jgi:hypothetical protein
MEANNKGVYLVPKDDFLPDKDFYVDRIEKFYESASKIYEKFNFTEHNLDIKRATDFACQETNTLINCNVYIVRKDDWQELKTELSNNGFSRSIEESVNAFSDRATSSVVVFVDDPKTIANIDIESKIVHETVHLVGSNFLSLKINENSQNIKANVEDKRGGLIANYKDGEKDYGASFEEALSDHFAIKYRQKFGDEQFFKDASKVLKYPIHSFDDLKLFPVKVGFDKNILMVLPGSYISADSNGVTMNKSTIFAYAFDVMNKYIYEKTGENLEKIALDAKKDPYKIKDLAKILDTNIGKGTYTRFQKIPYGKGDDDGRELSNFLNFLQERVKT